MYQAEMQGMGYNEVQQCHHQHIGRINQQVNMLGLLGAVALSETAGYATNYNRSQQNYYASQRCEQQQRYPNQQQYNPNEQPGYEQQVGNQQRQRYEQNQRYSPQQQQAMQENQQQFYPHQNVNPNQHRHHHCHCQHRGQNHQRNLGGDGQQQQQRRPQQGYQNTHYDSTYDGATYQAQDAKQNAKIVADVARQMGVDPVVAIAAMLVESGGNAQAVGDRGSSFGLFQLHRGGELGHMSPQQAFDPVTNARTALSQFKHGQVSNPGAMAAAAQRPADRAGYAAKVNARMAQAARLLQESQNA
jgi:hypothetical protein